MDTFIFSKTLYQVPVLTYFSCFLKYGFPTSLKSLLPIAFCGCSSLVYICHIILNSNTIFKLIFTSWLLMLQNNKLSYPLALNIFPQEIPRDIMQMYSFSRNSCLFFMYSSPLHPYLSLFPLLFALYLRVDSYTICLAVNFCKSIVSFSHLGICEQLMQVSFALWNFSLCCSSAANSSFTAILFDKLRMLLLISLHHSSQRATRGKASFVHNFLILILHKQ